MIDMHSLAILENKLAFFSGKSYPCEMFFYPYPLPIIMPTQCSSIIPFLPSGFHFFGRWYRMKISALWEDDEHRAPILPARVTQYEGMNSPFIYACSRVDKSKAVFLALLGGGK